MEHGETRIMRWLMRLFMDVESKTIASEVTRGWSKTQIGDGLLQDMLYRWSCCACLKKKSTDKTVSISVMWTVPVTMEMGGLLTVLILIIYCITMTKKNKISVTSMMITGFLTPPVRRSIYIFYFLVTCLFFMVYF